MSPSPQEMGDPQSRHHHPSNFCTTSMMSLGYRTSWLRCRGIFWTSLSLDRFPTVFIGVSVDGDFYQPFVSFLVTIILILLVVPVGLSIAVSLSIRLFLHSSVFPGLPGNHFIAMGKITGVSHLSVRLPSSRVANLTLSRTPTPNANSTASFSKICVSIPPIECIGCPAIESRCSNGSLKAGTASTRSETTNHPSAALPRRSVSYVPSSTRNTGRCSRLSCLAA